MHMSSAHDRHVAECNPKTRCPICRYGLNTRGLASTAAVGLVNASFMFFVIAAGSGLPFHFCQPRLGIEQIELARPALHEHEDDVLRLGRKCGFFGASGFTSEPRARGLPFSSCGQRDRADPARRIAKERPPRLDPPEFVRMSLLYSLVMNSSRFNNTRLSPTHAAASAGRTPSAQRQARSTPRLSDPCPGCPSPDRDISPAAPSPSPPACAPAPAHTRSPARSAEILGRPAPRAPCAASKNTTSSSRFSACSGVFDRCRRLHATFAFGRIERHQHRIRRRALEVDVEPAPIPVRPRALRPLAAICYTTAPPRPRAAADARSCRRPRYSAVPPPPAPRRGSVRAGRRSRDCRASSVFSGSRDISSGRAFDDCR